MIQEVVDVFMNNKDELRAKWVKKHPESYTDIVRQLFNLIGENSPTYVVPVTEKMVVVGGGEYQGAMAFVIPTCPTGEFYVTKIDYGSCSACDTFAEIRYRNGYCDDEGMDIPNEQQLNDYMTLALHLAQATKIV